MKLRNMIREIRVIRGHNPLMKHEELTKDMLNLKEATFTWKRVVRGRQQEDHGLRG